MLENRFSNGEDSVSQFPEVDQETAKANLEEQERRAKESQQATSELLERARLKTVELNDAADKEQSGEY
jgi:hypothetical protein